MRLGLWRHNRCLYFFQRIHPRENRKLKTGLTLLIFLSLCSLMLSYFEACVRPNLQLIAQSETSLYANKVINNAVTTVMKSYEKGGTFSVLEKDDTGSINAYRANTPMINRFSSDVSKEIYDHICNVKESTVSIPLGNVITKHAVFSRLGPRIRVRIKPLGFADIQYTTHFTNAGINEVRHEILLKIKVTMVAYIPGATTKMVVTSTVPIDETILMGKVPDNYTNFDANSKEVKDHFLDIAR